MRSQDPGDRFAAIARDLSDQPSQEATLDRIVEVAVQVISGCDHAAISLVTRRKIRTVATTDETATAGDEQQYSFNEGPCLDSIRNQGTVHAPNLGDDVRWPEWGPWVIEHLGVNSMLCFQLFTNDRSYGSLNLYGDRPDAFDVHDEAVGLALAAHAAVGLANSDQIEGLNTALGSRTIIGKAEGILMERFSLTAQQAFAVLIRVSQDENRRLVQVAAELVETGRTPGG